MMTHKLRNLLCFSFLLWIGTASISAQKKAAAFSPIEVNTPARPSGQRDVLNLVTAKLDTVRVGFIGLACVAPVQ
nr:CAZy families GH109 protein [uncultured Bacteroides sp.]